ncbi:MULTISPECIES: DUF4145 domain-containing protein [Vibrio]|uniref:DUF4145 domain-containing protein n=1 Tax=Vibrio TaxID=662 RepID=UPI001F4EED35|nr:MULTISPECIES: DUF4145 domain-containing protein [Vibrio]MDF4405224.1 DUF4145 domain-containing protein [Vibrio parahaemolyticus]MDF4609146.1 DUF4145 domain-containing protein [Vibrio parahaemolyticus]MEA5377619.1 DUF4145 domain-containing protein [Vibrio parahaemolyticus]
MSYEQPEHKKGAFTCPHCNAYAAMAWYSLIGNQSYVSVDMAICHRCKKRTIWLDGTEGYPVKLIYPNLITAPMPNEDMPQDCIQDYLEAREIASSSPKGAAALLRLCIQKLTIHLGGEGKNINADIGSLVSKGLPIKIQQALDFVRVVGNNAVHPGEISLDDDPSTVHALFGLINLIVDNQISQPKQVSALFDSLPEGAKNAVNRRDNKA